MDDWGGSLESAGRDEVVLALVCDLVWLTNSRSQRPGCKWAYGVQLPTQDSVLPCANMEAPKGEYISEQRQSWLSSWAAAASPTNGRAKAETGSIRSVFVFTDGTADRLVIEKEVVYVSYLTGGIAYYRTFLCNWLGELLKKQFSHEIFQLLQNYIIIVKEIPSSLLKIVLLKL